MAADFLARAALVPVATAGPVVAADFAVKAALEVAAVVAEADFAVKAAMQVPPVQYQDTGPAVAVAATAPPPAAGPAALLSLCIT